MSSFSWYWHRLKAMGAAELAGHGRRKFHQLSDALFSTHRFAGLAEVLTGGTFPQLPPPETAPGPLRAALRRDVADILAGRWVAFGHLMLQVDNPPRWHKDYLAGVDMATSRPALKLHHRLEGVADIKLIWEPNRWYSLVRLAQAAYVLGDARPAAQCVAWLNDWVGQNPPYFGWNWTSALETGLRLIEFVWIDALLSGKGNTAAASAMGSLRSQVLAPHLWFTWRDRSFGSSANNHLIGELSGLILALVRWPGLEKWAAPLATIQPLWEREVLAQFAADGGNREQALNYQLFSWEFCWQARLALRALNRPISPEAEARLRAAASFFTAVQAPEHPWDYGDSDSAFVTPLFAEWDKAASEWHQWMRDPEASPAIAFWMGAPPKLLQAPVVLTTAKHWRVYPDAGYAVCHLNEWFLRWDLSPLGYLSTASHGHCDALHLSLWYRGEPVFIDAGTGAYHADRRLRDYLASWEAHNGPHPVGAAFPERRGAFLWSAHHETPRWEARADGSLSGELRLPSGVARRNIRRLEEEDGWQIDDAFVPLNQADGPDTQVLWQLSPGARLEPLADSSFEIGIGSVTLTVEFGSGWRSVRHGLPKAAVANGLSPLYGSCSPAFRRVETAPFILAQGLAVDGTPLRTKISASRRDPRPR